MTLALVSMGAAAAACVQATTGLGFAMMLTPVLFALLPPTAAIVTVTALGLELNLLVLLGERRRPRVAWRELVPILAAATPGIACGVLLLRALPKPALQVGVGAVLILAALRRRSRASAARASTPGRLAVGFASGVLTTSTGVSGPPIALWLSRLGLAPGEVRDSLSAVFLAIGLIAFLALTPVITRAHVDPAFVGAGLACVLGGHAVGRRAFTRLEARRFEPLLRAVILCAGAGSIVAGLG